MIGCRSGRRAVYVPADRPVWPSFTRIEIPVRRIGCSRLARCRRGAPGVSRDGLFTSSAGGAGGERISDAFFPAPPDASRGCETRVALRSSMFDPQRAGERDYHARACPRGARRSFLSSFSSRRVRGAGRFGGAISGERAAAIQKLFSEAWAWPRFTMGEGDIGASGWRDATQRDTSPSVAAATIAE